VQVLYSGLGLLGVEMGRTQGSVGSSDEVMVMAEVLVLASEMTSVDDGLMKGSRDGDHMDRQGKVGKVCELDIGSIAGECVGEFVQLQFGVCSTLT